MTALVILNIIRLTLELAVEAAKSMPPEEAAKFWQRHEARMERWDRLFDKFGDRE